MIANRLYDLEFGDVFEFEGFRITRIVLGEIIGWAVYERGKLVALYRDVTKLEDYLTIVDLGSF
ncbi:hypothetical protein [Shimazuella alba]|uniref:Uncharacterized protein n=1 Tax=Shimazuella alba TaxID=2690964 RepID=A0A6I4VX74_9BACL|nr:hypothetical protein [Shimazuella alba]MXQ55261.1 hypothetical protein [Shimazuella alba]